MEDLIASLATSVQVSCTPNNTAAPHPRFAQYKQKKVEPPQEERRRKFLYAQKKKRYDFVNHARCLAENKWTTNSEDDEENDDCEEEMDFVSSPKKPPRSYKNQLMFSEWLVEVPSDLERKWLLVLCPEGKRSLIVSSQGQTRCYTKSGFLINTFPSYLPGGNKRQICGNAGYTLLDCIYNEQDRAYYILDIMCWNSHPVFDSETEFRLFWLQSKISEIPEVTKTSNRNPFKFIPLPSYSCELGNIKEVMLSPLPFPAKLDGLLFYHKETHYTPGSTPLVGWLKAYMLPEILNITVPSSLCTDRPSQYVSMEKHLSAAFNKHTRLENQKHSMDCQEENENKESHEEMTM